MSTGNATGMRLARLKAAALGTGTAVKGYRADSVRRRRVRAASATAEPIALSQVTRRQRFSDGARAALAYESGCLRATPGYDNRVLGDWRQR